MLQKTIFYLFISITIVSCGLNYTPPETPISQAEQRRTAIQNYLTATLQNDSTTYKSLAFGKTQTLKPLSYQRLDSLYGIKYNLEKQGRRNADLEDEILIQRQIALNDTNSMIYIESHLFSLTKNKVTTVYSAELRTNISNEITGVEIFETTNIAPQNLEMFQIYTFEESFLYPGYKPIEDELKFYRFYKGHAATLTGETKDKFVQNTLHVMRVAQRIQSLKTVSLLSELIRDRILGADRKLAKNETFDSMEEIYEKVNDQDVLTGYLVKYNFQKIENDLTTSYKYIIKASPYLEILSTGLY